MRLTIGQLRQVIREEVSKVRGMTLGRSGRSRRSSLVEGALGRYGDLPAWWPEGVLELSSEDLEQEPFFDDYSLRVGHMKVLYSVIDRGGNELESGEAEDAILEENGIIVARIYLDGEKFVDFHWDMNGSAQWELM